MISIIDGKEIRIQSDGSSRFNLTCDRAQIPVLAHAWMDNDFPPFRTVGDSVTSGGEADNQVVVEFGKGDPIEQYQAVLDAISGTGLE